MEGAISVAHATEAALERALVLIDEACPGWSAIDRSNGLQTRPYPNSGIPLQRASRRVRAPPRLVFDCVVKILSSAAKMRNYDPRVKKQATLAELGDGMRIDTVEFKMPWPVWDRDVVILLNRREIDGVLYVWAASIEHPSKLHSKRAYESRKQVRMKLGIACVRVEPDGGDLDSATTSRVTRMAHADPCGWIPDVLVKSTSHSQVKGILDFIAKESATEYARARGMGSTGGSGGGGGAPRRRRGGMPRSRL